MSFLREGIVFKQNVRNDLVLMMCNGKLNERNTTNIRKPKFNLEDVSSFDKWRMKTIIESRHDTIEVQ